MRIYFVIKLLSCTFDLTNRKNFIYMTQEIIVGIILLTVVAWLIRRMIRTINGQETHPCSTCPTPCKLKDEINKNKKKKSKKCTLSKENMPKN